MSEHKKQLNHKNMKLANKEGTSFPQQQLLFPWYTLL